MLAPQRVDDVLSEHHASGIDRKQGQERLLLARRDRDVPTIRITDLESAK